MHHHTRGQRAVGAIAVTLLAAACSHQAPSTIYDEPERVVGRRPITNSAEGQPLAASSMSAAQDPVQPAVGRRSTRRARPAALPQEPGTDYRVATLFNQNHGEMLRYARGYRPDVEFSFLSDTDQAIKGDPGSFDITQFNVDAAYEFAVDPDSWLRVGGHYRSRDFDFSSTFVGVDDDETLHELGLVLGGGTFFDPDLFAEVQFEPGLYSDFEGGLRGDDWRFYGHVRVTWRTQDNLFWRFGLRRDDLFEDLDIYPEIGVAWQFAENWRLNAFLPHEVSVQWNPVNEFLIDVGLSLEGNEYHVRAPSSVPGKPRFDWQTQEMRIFAKGTWRFDDRLAAFGKIGSTIGGDYEFNSTNGQSSGTPEGSLLFEVGGTYDW